MAVRVVTGKVGACAYLIRALNLWVNSLRRSWPLLPHKSAVICPAYKLQCSFRDIHFRSDIARQISENLDWKELLIKITAIRKEFVEATAILPSYELRQCELVRRSYRLCIWCYIHTMEAFSN